MRTPTTELQTMATMAHTDRPILSSWSMVNWTQVTYHIRGGSEVCNWCHVGHFNSTDSSWKERKGITWIYWIYFPSTCTHVPCTHSCWHNWPLLTYLSHGPAESTSEVSSDSIYGTTCVCPLSAGGFFILKIFEAIKDVAVSNKEQIKSISRVLLNLCNVVIISQNM